MNANGNSQWVPVSSRESWFGIGLAVVLSSGASLTYTVQFTMDYPFIPADGDMIWPNASITRSGTTATVVDSGNNGLGHGLSVNDSVIIKGTGATNLDSPGPAAGLGVGDVGVTVASVVSSTSWTYTVANSGPTADTGNTKIARLRVFNHATLVGLTARNNGSLNYPVQAVRLNVTGYSSGFADLIVLQGMPL